MPEMIPEEISVRRRALIGGSLAAVAVLALPGCATYPAFSYEEAIRRLLVQASERAFVRLTEPGGYWDRQVTQVGLDGYFGNRGSVLTNILTSTLFKSRLEQVAADIAIDASYRVAPVVADAVRTVGYANAVALIRGGPTAATTFLRQEMGTQLLNALVPEVGQALQVAEDPLVRELLVGLTGVDLGGVARGFAGAVEEVIWTEIGREEAAIRADPAATRDRVLMEAFGGGALP
ncbi:DUF4197 domain-containing protein [Altererythrobacter sp. Root672]|uniref:DUF4197 domain-containing protein n=1 Tax=Altererythrobacter sp. Root672 TaxID=1736584 RepID=UPI0006F43962|nr:DUF4197 domain-containing protein [Altererythrobacter sp. Root672]KRA83777.1 hypothetical protein ASD76_07095 [Altererythrobacter sp. Root672]